MCVSPRPHGTYAIHNILNTIRAKNQKPENRLYTILRTVV